MPPYCYYGFSKTRLSVGSKSWTQSPPLWIRSSVRTSNHLAHLDSIFLAPFLPFVSPVSNQWMIGQVIQRLYGWEDWQLVTIHSLDGYALDTPYFHGMIRVIDWKMERDIAIVIPVAYVWIMDISATWLYNISCFVSSYLTHFASWLNFFHKKIFFLFFSLSHRPYRGPFRSAKET